MQIQFPPGLSARFPLDTIQFNFVNGYPNGTEMSWAQRGKLETVSDFI